MTTLSDSSYCKPAPEICSYMRSLRTGKPRIGRREARMSPAWEITRNKNKAIKITLCWEHVLRTSELPLISKMRSINSFQMPRCDGYDTKVWQQLNSNCTAVNVENEFFKYFQSCHGWFDSAGWDGPWIRSHSHSFLFSVRDVSFRVFEFHGMRSVDRRRDLPRCEHLTVKSFLRQCFRRASAGLF